MIMKKLLKEIKLLLIIQLLVDGNKFDGSEGKSVQIELGKDLFLKGFDEQLIGVKKKI